MKKEKIVLGLMVIIILTTIIACFMTCYKENTLNKDKEVKEAIVTYLEKRDELNYKHHENEKRFYSVKLYDKKREKNSFIVYALTLDSNFYKEDNEVKEDGGGVFPYKFVLKRLNGNLIVVDAIHPRDGTYYVSDMKDLFPYWIRNKIHNRHSIIEKLQKEIEEQKEEYFKEVE